MHPHHSSFDWMNLTSSGRNEIVFRNRNQLYGAYLIRREYGRTLFIALFLACAPLFIALGLSLRFLNAPESEAPSNAFEDTFTFDAIEPPVEVPPAPAPPPAETPIEKPSGFKFVASDLPESSPHEDIIPSNPAAPYETGNNSGGQNSNTGLGDSPPNPFPEIEVDQNTYVTVSEMPEFPGGEAALIKYIATHVQYPGAALEMGIKGTVHVSFVVDGNGNVVEVSLKRGVKGGEDLNKEAMRVIASLPRWSPGKHNGHPARVSFILPVTFVSK